mmetsp:Transcript_80407/g.132958  ORF Transcript_80407/g.132958 Transcript_80407/m.132958 type:complete len:90 (-) Transcript_80407:13-282(-)
MMMTMPNSPERSRTATPPRAHLSSAVICFLRRPMVVFAVAAAVVVTCQQPPATVFPQVFDLHFQIPPAVLLTESLPQKVQWYLERCEIK